MMHGKREHRILECLLLGLIFFMQCGSKKETASLFVLMDEDQTGLRFTNKLTATPAFNMFHYMYFYNGAGVGAGDFNNDGRIDLFFASNQARNQLYLNDGNLKFRDVTEAARIPDDKSWSTGVSVVDVNNDGLLDIYVCKLGNYMQWQSRNQLLVCQGLKEGIPFYRDEAAAYGVDFSGFSTQAAFLDYDMDGDLDLFLINHSVHQNGTFAERKNFIGTYHPLSGDRLYRNDGSRFADVTQQSRINSSAISYGLGIAVSDINLDGWPDLYIGNDFHENDYLYINRKDGTFSEEITERTMHTSQFSMGIDIADINNDAHPEIISMDMLPSDPYILKRSLGEDEYNIFNLKIRYGYNHQYARNNLQLNRRNGLFSEVGMYAGVFATDWSWAPLWMDFDNDGWKDLFVSNGIPKRLNDIDYVNYVSNDEIQEKIRNNKLAEGDMALIDKFPQIKLPNKFYRNEGSVHFRDMSDGISEDRITFSNGAVYADFDNDGDLDIVVNNIDDPVALYRNRTNDGKEKRRFLELTLRGPEKNRNAVGSRVVVFAGNELRTYEKYPVRGFLSSMEQPLHIGLHNVEPDSMILVWPDNTYESITATDSAHTITYRKGLRLFDFTLLSAAPAEDASKAFDDITGTTSLIHRHEENPFVEFDREPLIPFMVSREGPALAVGDANGDGREDVFIGSSKNHKTVLFLQTAEGRFQRSQQPALDNDSTYEDVDAALVDLNGDRHPDLVVASGGNEYYGTDERLLPRVYLNDGKGIFLRKSDAFAGLFLTASCVLPYDINKDGATDLFIGGRAVPWEYGQVPQSYLLLNDGSGKFSDVTSSYSRELSHAGFVKDGVWNDLDEDGDPDLVLALEWDGICAFINEGKKFTRKYLTTKKGLWNFVLPADMDADGDIDFVAGNQGQNTRLKATDEEPIRMYYHDFDDNGKKEQVLTYFLDGKEIPFANKDELQKQMPVIKKRFLYADELAKARLSDILTDKKLMGASVFTANYLSNAVLINDGQGNFQLQALPWEAQLTPFKTAVALPGKFPDLLLMGNFYENNIQMGRYDADYGTLLRNKGSNQFHAGSIPGVSIKGQVRHILPIRIRGKISYVLVRNNDSTMIISPHR